MNNRQLGLEQERVAVLYLKKNGFHIVATNYYTPYGELDIIAIKKKVLSFIEVKYRHKESMQSPGQAITKKKQMRIINASQHFLMNHQVDYGQLRFDVIAIQDNQPIEHITNAFRADHTIM